MVRTALGIAYNPALVVAVMAPSLTKESFSRNRRQMDLGKRRKFLKAPPPEASDEKLMYDEIKRTIDFKV